MSEASMRLEDVVRIFQDPQARIDQLEGLLRFLLKNDQIKEVSINVVQSILAEGDDRE
jgi:hypothetical protein